MVLNSLSQSASYSDVAVIVNDNSQVSMDIANYFQSERNIPSENMIHVLAPSTEIIDSIEFVQIRSQIESHLLNMPNVGSINYLVTTKGLPLKVDSSYMDNGVYSIKNASFDSELSLILGPLSSSIGQNGALNNPYYGDSMNFDRDSSGIFLVTRLDGYSKADVFALIDRSGPMKGLNKLSAKGIVDLNNATASDSAFFASQFMPAYDFFGANQWNSEIDLHSDPYIQQDNVFSYLSIGHGPQPTTVYDNNWTEGAVGAMIMCSSAYTFDQDENSDDHCLVANLIADGCTGIIGYTDVFYFSQIWNSELFVERYFGNSGTFNLAESFYMAEKSLSWHSVVIGDPKASIMVDNFAEIIQPKLFNINLYPNPSNGVINIKSTKMINSILVMDIQGSLVKNYSNQNGTSIKLDLSELESGIYFIQISSGNETIQKRVVVN